MNEDLQTFARTQLSDGLAKCTDDEQLMFKRMYSHENLEAEIGDVVAAIPEDKLDWAMQQVSRTLSKRD